MKKIYDKVMNWLPPLWGALWMAIITIGSVAVLIWVTRWLLSSVGVL